MKLKQIPINRFSHPVSLVTIFASVTIVWSASVLLADNTIASGSGFAVSAKGDIVTNAHVIRGCSSVNVQILDKTSPADIAFQDDLNDLALLKVRNRDTVPLRFRREARPRLGESVVAFGYPLQGILASSLNVTSGMISGLAGLGNDTRFLQFTAPIQPGNSGGPLLDQTGHIVGVVSSKLSPLWTAKNVGDLPQNVNFAMKANTIRDLLDSRGIQYVTDDSREARETPVIAEAAQSSVAFVECVGKPEPTKQIGTEIVAVQRRWRSLETGLRYLLKLDGDHLYIEGVGLVPPDMSDTRSVQGDLRKSGDKYTGSLVIAGTCKLPDLLYGGNPPQIKNVYWDYPMELHFASPNRIEGNSFAPIRNAKFNCRTESYPDSVLQWQSFVWIADSD